jgi:hypothetical protein
MTPASAPPWKRQRTARSDDPTPATLIAEVPESSIAAARPTTGSEDVTTFEVTTCVCVQA